MNKLRDAVLIINPYSSPLYLYEQFKAADLFTLVCFTTAQNYYFTKPILDNNLFDSLLFLSKNLDQDLVLIKKIIKEKSLNLILAFSSSEYELPYSDQIAHHFCPDYTNSPATSHWRCNKGWTNHRLWVNGTPASKQQVIRQFADIQWGKIEFPVIIKPAEGSGASMGVTICNSPNEIETYFHHLDQKQWAYDCEPDEFLLEEYLHSLEYSIDIVAWNSQFYITSIYYCEKDTHGDYKLLRHLELLAPENPIAKELSDYCSTVLRNVDFQYGMANLDCMYTPKGPILIELNPRVSGVSGMLNYCPELINGVAQASLFIRLMQAQGKISAPPKPPIKKYGIIFFLQNFGFSYTKVCESLFTELPSYQRHSVKIPSQAEPFCPHHLIDTVAFILLAHNSLEQINNDLKKLRAFEASGTVFE